MTRTMTPEQVAAAMEALSPQLDKFAKLLVVTGAAIKPGQELVLTAPVEAAEFAQRVVAAGYAAGAGHVTVIWTDDVVSRLEYENTPLEWFQHVPSWKKEQLNSLAAEGAAFLWLAGDDPMAFAGVDPAKPQAASRARNRECDVYRHGMDYGLNQWSIGGVAVPGWARAVFPDLPEDEAMLRLWEAILSTSRADGDDPVATWEEHNASFRHNRKILNDYHFDALHYTSSNGTDLLIGMNDKHTWGGGSHHLQDGHEFEPNIPTEEVFTTPDRLRAEGVVHAVMPLVHQGSIVDNFWVRFEGGEVVDFGAEKGAEILENILSTDEGAKRLGEVALISKSSPIRATGLLFFNTLYDENASCHLALGRGFADCYEGAEQMSTDEQVEHGVNFSLTHVDFMVGADDLCITGITADGEEVPVFMDGAWAWE